MEFKIGDKIKVKKFGGVTAYSEGAKAEVLGFHDHMLKVKFYDGRFDKLLNERGLYLDVYYAELISE